MKNYLKTGVVLLGTLGAVSTPMLMSAQKAPAMEVDKVNDIIVTPGPVYRGVKAHPATEAQKNDPEQVKMAEHMKSSEDFKDLPDEIQKLIVANQGNYYVSGNYNVLFKNNEFLIKIGQKGKAFALERTSFNRPEDILFVYEKEKPKQWVELKSSEIKSAQKDGKLSKDDIAYLKALLEITNENIQYLYGADFKAHNVANMSTRDERTSKHDKFKENLIGRYIPHKMLTFCAFDTQLDDKAMDDMFEKPHMLELSKQLGRPVYDMRNYYDKSQKIVTPSRCSTGGDARVTTYDGFPWTLSYYTSLPFDEMDRSYKISTASSYLVKEYIRGFSHNVIDEMEKQGVDLNNYKNNDTPLKKALYMYAAKTLDLTHQIHESDVHKKFDTSATGVKFGKAESLADMIPVKKSSLSTAAKKMPSIVSNFKAMDPYLKPHYLAEVRQKPFISAEYITRLEDASAKVKE